MSFNADLTVRTPTNPNLDTMLIPTSGIPVEHTPEPQVTAVRNLLERYSFQLIDSSGNIMDVESLKKLSSAQLTVLASRIDQLKGLKGGEEPRKIPLSVLFNPNFTLDDLNPSRNQNGDSVSVSHVELSSASDVPIVGKIADAAATVAREGGEALLEVGKGVKVFLGTGFLDVVKGLLR